MMEVFQFFGVLLSAFGLVSLVWLALGAMLLPVDCPTRAVVTGRGRGDGLEQTVRALMWLRRTGLWRGVVVIEDGGLDEKGLALARKLVQCHGVEFKSAEPNHK